MIQSDCGLVLRPICLISSATSAGLLSEHTPPAAKAKINTHTCINKKKTGITAKDFLLLRNKRRDNQQQSYCTRGNPTKKNKKNRKQLLCADPSGEPQVSREIFSAD